MIDLRDMREPARNISMESVEVNSELYLLLKDICLFYRIGFTYDPVTKAVTLKKDNKTVMLSPDTKELMIDNKKVVMDRPPVIVNWKMVVPPKGMANILEELLNCPVTWRSSARVFTVNDKDGVSFWEDNPVSEEKTDLRDNILKPGDILSISVWQKGSYELDELTREREIEEDGTIKFPFTGDITTSGLNPSQLESRIAGKLKAYIKDPEVTVRIKNKTTYKVQIFGAVRNPGTYEFSEKATLMEAVNKAGGFGDEAKLTQVRVTRFIHHSPYQTDVINCKLILYKGQRQYDVPVDDKDIIFVPKGAGFWNSVGNGLSKITPLLSATALMIGVILSSRAL
ncbi:MAG: polysaccharide biosynthesis/export family protein [Elusimicrobiota bacterium]